MSIQSTIPAKMATTATAIAIISSGCESLGRLNFAATTCENLRQNIIELSEKDRASRGFALVAIYEPTEISKTDKELYCRGNGAWSDGDKTKITYKQYIDQEENVMIEYDVSD